MAHAYTQVRNAPKTSWFRLQHEINQNLLQQHQIGLRSSYETLHCLLDRKVALRRQVDLAVEDPSHYLQQLEPKQPHECQGRIKAVRSLRAVNKFRQCNQLCRLTQEGRSKLLALEESLRAVHALQLR